MKLSGLTAMLTRQREDNRRLAAKILELGGEVIENPLIEVKYLETNQVGCNEVSKADAIVVTSANALLALAPLLRSCEQQSGLPPCFVVGNRTARVAEELGLHAVHPDGVLTAEDLSDYLIQSQPAERNRRFLWPHGQLASLQFKDKLQRAGFIIQDFVCYDTQLRSVTGANWARAKRAERLVVVFYSPSAVEAFMQSDSVQKDLASMPFTTIAVGTRTAKRLEDVHLPIGSIATNPSLDGVLAAIAESYERGHLI